MAISGSALSAAQRAITRKGGRPSLQATRPDQIRLWLSWNCRTETSGAQRPIEFGDSMAPTGRRCGGDSTALTLWCERVVTAACGWHRMVVCIALRKRAGLNMERKK